MRCGWCPSCASLGLCTRDKPHYVYDDKLSTVALPRFDMRVHDLVELHEIDLLIINGLFCGHGSDIESRIDEIPCTLTSR